MARRWPTIVITFEIPSALIFSGPASGPLDRIGDRAGRDDRSLAGHQPRDRGDRAQASRLGERDVGAGEVVGGELVLPASW